ncbi:MAG TPA: sigma-70 family RNA polymerase sigma factor [Polyangia bacterium]
MSTYRKPAPISLLVTPERRDLGDADVARSLIAGEPWATIEVWHRFAPMVLTMATRTLGSEAEADDVAQEVFQRLFRKVKTLREPDRLRSFVFSIAIRVVKSELRGKKSRGWLEFHQPGSLDDREGEGTDHESRDLLKRFYALLDRLKPRDRLVFSLRHMESMTVEEIAASMDISISTVKRSLEHAITRLSGWIEKDPGLVDLLDRGGWMK